jgi:hypothetical protein
MIAFGSGQFDRLQFMSHSLRGHFVRRPLISALIAVDLLTLGVVRRPSRCVVADVVRGVI